MNSTWRDVPVRVALALLLVILTFPRFDIVSDVGVDNSLAWAFNHLFATGLDQAAHLIFPHGPLAFLMYPQALGGDLHAALIGVVLILGTFHFVLLSLGANTRHDLLLWHVIVATLLAAVVQVQMQLVGIVGAALVLHWRTGRNGWLALAILSALVALQVRAGVGIMAMTLLFAHAILLLWRRRAWKTVVLMLAGGLGGSVLLRWILFGHLTGLLDFHVGLFELSRTSSAATGLHPDNNWWVIVPAIALFWAIPLVTKEHAVRHLFALFALALFAAWKHGITREDVEHARGLFLFVLLFFGTLALAWRTPRAMPVLMAGAVVVLGYRALAFTSNYNELNVAPIGVNRLVEWTFDRPAMTARAIERSTSYLAKHQLPAPLAERLRAGTVDVYPWEFSYLPANDLRWRPRPVLQSYASYTPWLDRRNADFFNAGKGADRILWHFLNNGRAFGHMGDADRPYLLNDEPNGVVALLDHYQWTAGTDRVAILERSPARRLGQPRIIGRTEATWDSWIPVPDAPEGILRAKVKATGTLWRALKDFVYKDAYYTVLYRLEDGRTVVHRFVPDLATEGVWVAPFIQHPEDDHMEPAVTAIRFRCDAPGMTTATLPVEWESIPLLEEGASAFGLFGKHRSTVATDQQISVLDMEGPAPLWQGQLDHVRDSLAHSGRFAYRLSPDRFSPTYQRTLDSLAGPVHVRGGAWVHASPGAELAIVLSVEDSTGTIFWETQDARPMLHGPDEWWWVHIDRDVPTGHGRTLKAYAWNTGRVPVLVDDLSVEWSTAPVGARP